MILTVCPNPSVDKFLYLADFKADSVNRSLREEAFPGGKGVHVALALKQLRMPTELIGTWGGPTGRWIRQECERKGVECFGPELSGWTRRIPAPGRTSAFSRT
jgi:tagatose 6-phosphate kinase